MATKQIEEAPITQSPPGRRLLNTDQAANYIGVDPSNLRISRVTGKLGDVPAPKYLKFGARKYGQCRYDLRVLDEWIDDSMVGFMPGETSWEDG